MNDTEAARLEEIRTRWSLVSPTPWSLDSTELQVFASDGTTVATHSCDGFWAGSGPPLKGPDAVAIAAAPRDIDYLLNVIASLTAASKKNQE